MIDIHSHILPGIDDGPDSLDASLEMARAYVNAGFTKIVATPHWISGTSWTPAAQDVLRQIASFNQTLKNHLFELSVYSGMEIAFDSDIAGLLAHKKVLPLAGGPYVLIESPFQRFPAGWEQVFSAVLSKGYKVLLAHPERCEQVVGDPSFVEAFLDAGVYLQVNCDSFLGGYGKLVQQTAVLMASKGYVHCVATDSHDSVNRSPANTFETQGYLEKLVGPENYRILAFQNPRRVLNGETLAIPQIASSEKPKIKRWKFW